MSDQTTMLFALERALDEIPWCRACGSPTTIVVDGERYLLVCAATARTTGIRARLSAALTPHERRLVLDTGDRLAA